MGLIDQLLADSTHHGPVCRLSQHLNTLPAKDRDELIEAVRHPGISGAALARHFQPRGLKIDAAMWLRHKRNECFTCQTTGWFA